MLVIDWYSAPELPSVQTVALTDLVFGIFCGHSLYFSMVYTNRVPKRSRNFCLRTQTDSGICNKPWLKALYWTSLTSNVLVCFQLYMKIITKSVFSLLYFLPSPAFEQTPFSPQVCYISGLNVISSAEEASWLALACPDTPVKTAEHRAKQCRRWHRATKIILGGSEPACHG